MGFILVIIIVFGFMAYFVIRHAGPVFLSLFIFVFGKPLLFLVRILILPFVIPSIWADAKRKNAEAARAVALAEYESRLSDYDNRPRT